MRADGERVRFENAEWRLSVDATTLLGTEIVSVAGCTLRHLSVEYVVEMLSVAGVVVVQRYRYMVIHLVVLILEKILLVTIEL
jgi:hypothetical protein